MANKAHTFESELSELKSAANDGSGLDTVTAMTMTLKVPREIKRKFLKKSDKIGEGAFGEVNPKFLALLFFYAIIYIYIYYILYEALSLTPLSRFIYIVLFVYSFSS